MTPKANLLSRPETPVSENPTARAENALAGRIDQVHNQPSQKLNIQTHFTGLPFDLPENSVAGRRTSFQSHLRGLWLMLCGETGGILVSLLAIAAAANVVPVAGPWLLEAMLVLVGSRFVLAYRKQYRAVLRSRLLRTDIKTLLQEEALVAVICFAAAFAFDWPISRSAAALFLFLNLSGQTALYMATRTVSRWITSHRKSDKPYRFDRLAVIAGTGPRAFKVADAIMHAPELGTHLLGFLDYHKTGFWRYHDAPLIGHPDCLERIIIDGQVDALFIALEPDDIPRSAELFRVAERTGVDIYLLPDIYQSTLAHPGLASLNGLSTLVYRTTTENRLSLLCKGFVDRLGALIGIVLAAPIMLAVALAIKLDSPGPVLFKQTRSGLNGKRFPLYKFRTMCTDAEKRKADLATQNEMSGPVFKIKADPRVTRLGRTLRKYSVDELPQLFNILAGDMSLVGPRPPLPSEVTKFEAWQRRKLSVKPGLTCLWQVNGRNAIDFEDWMRLDLEYIDNWSLLLDAKILLKTVPTVLKGSGH